MNRRRALFLDRDGIVNIEKNYLYKVEDFEFCPGIFELCQYFLDKEYWIFLITNQAGIAKGYYTEEDFITLNQWMLQQFTKKGITIQEAFYCPHHPKGSKPLYSIDCNCRKPKPGMLLRAAEKYSIDLKNSILIGDKESDIEAGIQAGIQANWLVKTHPNEDYNCLSKSNFQFSNLKEVVNYLKEYYDTNNNEQ